jgi:hypothetical protein
VLLDLFDFDSQAALRADLAQFPRVPVEKFLAQRARNEVAEPAPVLAPMPAATFEQPAPEVVASRPEKAFVDAVFAELRNVQLVALADMVSGLSLASHMTHSVLDAEIQVAYHAAMLHQQVQAGLALGLGQTAAGELLISTDYEWHLSEPLDDNYFVYLTARKADTNLALVRNALRRHRHLLTVSLS